MGDQKTRKRTVKINKARHSLTANSDLDKASKLKARASRDAELVAQRLRQLDKHDAKLYNQIGDNPERNADIEQRMLMNDKERQEIKRIGKVPPKSKDKSGRRQGNTYSKGDKKDRAVLTRMAQGVRNRQYDGQVSKDTPLQSGSTAGAMRR